MSLSDNLKGLRNSLGITQDTISKDLKINRATYAHYETGRREPDIEMINILADYFNVSVDYLLGRTDIKESTSYIPEEIKKGDSNSDYLSEEIQDLSPESQEEIKKLIELYKIRDMQKRNTEVSDELTNLD